MGRGSTWSRQLPWLTRLGAVYTYDAPWHRGRDVEDPHPISTERFVADLGEAVAALGRPGRHGRPLDGRAALVVPGRDAARTGQCARRRGHGAGLPGPHHRPVGAVAARACRSNSSSAQEVYDEFGPVAGQYFLEAFDRTATGWRLHGHTEDWIEIAARVGHPRLLGAVGGGAGPRAADRGRQLRHAAGADAQNAGNRLPDNVFARARRRSPDPRRCAADLPRGGRVVSSDARSTTPELGQNGCCSKRVRTASTSCPTRKASRSSSKNRPDMGPAIRNWSMRSRKEPERWAAQLSAAATAKGAIRMRKVSAVVMAVILR